MSVMQCQWSTTLPLTAAAKMETEISLSTQQWRKIATVNGVF